MRFARPHELAMKLPKDPVEGARLHATMRYLLRLRFPLKTYILFQGLEQKLTGVKAPPESCEVVAGTRLAYASDGSEPHPIRTPISAELSFARISGFTTLTLISAYRSAASRATGWPGAAAIVGSLWDVP